MTFKNLVDELSGVSIENYNEIISFVQELKTKNNSNDEIYMNLDWTVSDDNWNEKEIW